MSTDNYTPAMSKDAYFPAGEDRIARLWSREKTIHDLADTGIVEFFEGPGADPTVLPGYSTAKLWLNADGGVTAAAGTVRYYSGGVVTDIASWPALTRSGFANHIGLGAGDLLAANNLSDVANVTTARTNLGAASASDVTALTTTVSGKADTVHTHAASAITSGTLVHERGGLEADVSAFNGTVRISGGATSALSVVSQAEAEAGTATAVREWTAQRVAQTAIARNAWTYMPSRATSSGTQFDFTGIPTTVAEIEIVFQFVSLTGTTDNILVQIGDSGGFKTSFYNSVSSILGNSGTSASTCQYSSDGLIAYARGNINTTTMRLIKFGTGYWSSTHAGFLVVPVSVFSSCFGGGSMIITVNLDRVRVTRTGSVSFNGGSIDLRYR